jgi:hypothetical protein
MRNYVPSTQCVKEETKKDKLIAEAKRLEDQAREFRRQVEAL